MNYKQVEVSSVQPVVQGVIQPNFQTSVQAVDIYPVGVQAANPAIEGDAIRADFIYFLCCAFSCGNTDFPACFGGRSECTLCCYEYSAVCMKCVDDPKTCCICQSGGLECVHPRKCYSEYYQLCCFECYASLPPVRGAFKKIHTRPNHATNNFVLSDEATLCYSFLCCLSSCNCHFPSCFGVYQKNVCLCQEIETTCYKPMCCTPQKKNKDTLCIVFNGHNACVRPYTCCKVIDQCFCCDYRCALPCDEEVPCVLGFCLFCTACVDWQCYMNCCGTINQILRNTRATLALGQNTQGRQVNPNTTNMYHHTNNTNNNQFNESQHGAQYQQVQYNLGGSPYTGHQGSAPYDQGSVPYNQGSAPYYNQGSAHGSTHGYDPHATQQEHQYKQIEHSAPMEVVAQLAVAYEV